MRISDWSSDVCSSDLHALDVYRKAIEVNLIGTFNVISKFAARLAAADPIGEERGVIVNTASVAAYDGQIGQAAYASSKGGVVGMTLPVARDLSQHLRSEEHTSELQSLMRISYAVFCLKKKKNKKTTQ